MVLLSGSSRVRGNLHARFPGEDEVATPRPYPTDAGLRPLNFDNQSFKKRCNDEKSIGTVLLNVWSR